MIFEFQTGDIVRALAFHVGSRPAAMVAHGMRWVGDVIM